MFFCNSITSISLLVTNSTWEENLTGVYQSSLAWGDIDNDGDFDIIIAGCKNGGLTSCTTVDKTRIYLNNGTNLTESLSWEENLTDVWRSSLAFGDINNDGDLDLVLTGHDGTHAVTRVYINNGTNLTESITWQENLTGTNIYFGSIALGDVDNNGKLDLAVIGADTAGENGIYLNNGTNFVRNTTWLSELPKVGLGLGSGSLAFGDLDNDNDLDLVIAGSISTDFYSKVYINNGTSLVENSDWRGDFLANFGWPSLALGDYDNDGDLDLTAIGTRAGDHLQIHNNTGSTFSLHQENGPANNLPGLFDGSVAWGDYNNNGYLDIATNGKEGWSGILNNSQNIFSADTKTNANLLNLQTGSSILFIDLDNNSRLDLVEVGDNSGSQAKVYTSNVTVTNNTAPGPPTGDFGSSYANDRLTLVWGNGSDTETGINGLYYNLRVGTTSGGNDVVSGIYGGSSNPTAGYFGNMMQRHKITLEIPDLQNGTTYYWSVQTIDTALNGSAWSAEQSYTTEADITDPTITVHALREFYNTTDYNITFNATASDDINLINITLWGNWSTREWHANLTDSTGTNNTAYNFSVDLTVYGDGQYIWSFRACDNSENCVFSDNETLTIDNSYPNVTLVSPANDSTWTSSQTVTFNYNVTDLHVKNCSLLIDDAVVESDLSVDVLTQQSFLRSVANGNYNWSVNCTDYTGHTNNSKTWLLSVSYSPPTNGGGGGGSGGPSKKPVIVLPKFDIDFSTTSSGSFQAKQGDVKTFSFNGEVTHKISLTEVTKNSVKLIIESDPITLIINVGETKKIDINSDGLYDFEIKLVSIKNNKATFSLKKLEGADIVAQEELEELIRKEALFDVKVSVLDKFKEVFPGEEVTAKIEVFNVNNIGQVDVKVDYYLSDNESVLAKSSDSLAVEAVASFVRSLIVPDDVKPGTYLFNANVSYKGIVTSGSAEFKVKSKRLGFIQEWFREIIIGVIVLVIIGVIAYLIMLKKKEEKIEKREQKIEKKEEKLEKEIKGVIKKFIKKRMKRRR